MLEMFKMELIRLESDEKRLLLAKKLVESSMTGNMDMVKRLLEQGASVNAEEYNKSLFYMSKNYMTPLQYAARDGYSDIVKLLIENEACLDAKDRFDVTAVHMAAAEGRSECLVLLLDAGAGCNGATKYSKHGCYTATPHPGGTTPLHLAARHNHVDCVRELIQNGADYNAVNEYGQTSLYIAAKNGFSECVLTHLHNAIGRDILSLPVISGDTPLHECISHGLFDCVKLLLKHGSDVNHRNSNGFSPLHYAVFNNKTYSLDILRALLMYGYNVDVNLRDLTGLTPLHYVCFSGSYNRPSLQERRPEAAELLIAYGADISIKSARCISLLRHELSIPETDRTILSAIIKSERQVIPISLDSSCIHTLPPRGTDNKLEWYNEIARSARSLQHYCRHTIRSCLSYRRLRKIHSLPLPRNLIDYLLLQFDEYK